MKLWWVHCEAMVATLMAFTATRQPHWWRMFTQVYVMACILPLFISHPQSSQRVDGIIDHCRSILS